MKKFVIGCILILLMMSIVSAGRTRIIDRFMDRIEENKPTTNDLFTFCEVDRDCFKITTTKCGCSNGGEEIAVNMFGLYYYGMIKMYQEDGLCIELFRCTFRRPRCVEETCTLI